MRKKCCFMMMVLCLLGSLLTGCAKMVSQKTDRSGAPEPIELEDGPFSYQSLEQLGEVSVSENVVTIVLEEDQALPFRWEYQIDGEGVSLDKDFVVDKPEESSMFPAVGSAPAFRVFQIICTEDAKGFFHAYCKHLYSDDMMGERHFDISFQKGEVRVENCDRGHECQ